MCQVPVSGHLNLRQCKILCKNHNFIEDPVYIRWFAMENAATTVHKCYGLVVACVQSNEGKNTIVDNIRGCSKMYHIISFLPLRLY
jgi:hypothetical protein